MLAMVQLGNKLDIIRNYRDGADGKRDVVAFEAGLYTEMFETLVAMPWRCVEAQNLHVPWEVTTDVPLCEALVTISPTVFMLKGAQFWGRLKNTNDRKRWDDVLAAIAVFEDAYAYYAGELFDIMVAIRAYSGACYVT